MTPNNNLSILPFYSDVSYQNHRKDYAQGIVYPLITPINTILPFQIVRPHSATYAPVVKLYNGKEGNSFVDITSIIINTGLFLKEYVEYDIIQYNALFSLNITMSIGEHYIEIYDGVDYYYSEVFTTVGSIDDCLKIQYWSYDNIEYTGGIIDYSDQFKSVVYLQTQLGMPDYVFEEEAEKRDGYSFVKKQISEKTFKFNFLAPEYLLDAMRVIRMSDNITITNKYKTYTADEFLITPNWEVGGYIASVEAEFQSDTVLKKIGSIIPSTTGDFNNDFNNDFKIT